jgi:Mn2+/Fe2+ NRAMP family transporter
MSTDSPKRTARLTAMLLVSALLVGTFAAGTAGAATKDPKTTRQVAALIIGKNLGCKDFATLSNTSAAGSALQAVVALVGNASVATCTVNDQQTVVVVFKTPKARQQFETRVRSLPCPIVTALVNQLAPSATSTSTPSTTTVKIPVAEIGSRSIIFSTGSAPGTDTVDLAAAATSDGAIGKKIGGKLRTFTFTC